MQKLNVYQKSIELNGEEVFYRQIGHLENSKHNLFILHGLQNSGSYFWQDFMKKFEYDYDFCVIMPDLPGFGDNKNLSLKVSLDTWLDQFINALNIQKPNFLAHSFGNVILLNLLKSHEFNSLNILTSAPFEIKNTKLRVPATIFSNKLLWFLKPIFWSKKLNKFLKLKCKIHIFENENGLDIFKKSWQKFDVNMLGKLDKPALLMYGSKDLLTPPELGRKYRSKIKNCILVTIEGAGHDLFLDSPNELYLNTKSFLNNFNK